MRGEIWVSETPKNVFFGLKIQLLRINVTEIFLNVSNKVWGHRSREIFQSYPKKVYLNVNFMLFICQFYAKRTLGICNNFVEYGFVPRPPLIDVTKIAEQFRDSFPRDEKIEHSSIFLCSHLSFFFNWSTKTVSNKSTNVPGVFF